MDASTLSTISILINFVLIIVVAGFGYFVKSAVRDLAQTIATMTKPQEKQIELLQKLVTRVEVINARVGNPDPNE